MLFYTLPLHSETTEKENRDYIPLSELNYIISFSLSNEANNNEQANTCLQLKVAEDLSQKFQCFISTLSSAQNL